MRFRRNLVGIGTVVVVLFVFGFSQLQAQSGLTLEGLSSRITTLTRRVSALANAKASRGELIALENRVATLEARSGVTRPTNTPTRRRPTSTPTRVRPTATPTPAQASISIKRNMNVRRGPGTNYIVLGYATVGEQFNINGKNADGSWWRISFNGKNGWIYAPFVTAINTRDVPVVPALAPLPTNTPSPQPTQTQYSSVEYATILMGMDWNRRDLQRRWSNFSEDQKSVILLATAAYLELTAEYCNMSLQDAGRMINRHGQYLDDTGYTIRNDIRARSFLMLVLTEAEEAAHTPYGCDNWLSQATSRLLAAGE